MNTSAAPGRATATPPARRRGRRLGPRGRKTVLTAHIVLSVGWLGCAVMMVALGIIAASADPELRAGAYSALHSADRLVMIPMSLAALLSGLLSSLTSPWGLTRHWWVLAKLVLTVGAMLFAALYTSQQVKAVLAGDGSPSTVVLSALTMVAILLSTTVLSVFKPWGRTRQRRAPRPGESQA